jgi:hypothetical protein
MRIGVGFGVKYLLELEKNVWVTAGGVPGLHMMAWTFRGVPQKCMHSEEKF